MFHQYTVVSFCVVIFDREFKFFIWFELLVPEETIYLPSLLQHLHDYNIFFGLLICIGIYNNQFLCSSRLNLETAWPVGIFFCFVPFNKGMVYKKKMEMGNWLFCIRIITSGYFQINGEPIVRNEFGRIIRNNSQHDKMNMNDVCSCNPERSDIP